MNQLLIRKSLMASSVALTLGAPGAEAELVTGLFPGYFVSDSANFTMLYSNGGVIGGTNDVAMHWDSNGYNSSSDYTGPGVVSNVTLSTTTPFFSHIWTAHDIQMFTPGSYTFDVTLGGGNSEGTGGTSFAQFMNVTVGASQLGMHMLFDWNGNNNIDVFVVFAKNSVFGSGLLYSTTKTAGGGLKCDANFTNTIVKNCLYDGANYASAGAPTKNQTWMLASVDGDGDGLMGIAMTAGGPLGGLTINFNASPTPVPVPASVWLFGSGLMGLVAAARRKKKTETT